MMATRGRALLASMPSCWQSPGLDAGLDARRPTVYNASKVAEAPHPSDLLEAWGVKCEIENRGLFPFFYISDSERILNVSVSHPWEPLI